MKKYNTKSGKRFDIRGKIDGLATYFDENGKPRTKLVEIKNRTQRLFGGIPRYERIQLCFYLHFMDLEESELVERYRQDILIHPFKKDEKLYKQARVATSRCVEFLIDMWSNVEKIRHYQSLSTDERNEFLNKNMPIMI